MNILKKLKLDIIFLGIDCPVHFNKARRTKLVQNSATPNHNNNYSMGYSYTDICFQNVRRFSKYRISQRSDDVPPSCLYNFLTDFLSYRESNRMVRLTKCPN